MVESTFKTFPHMRFFMLYTMVMSKTLRYALKRSFVNVFIFTFVAFRFFMDLYGSFPFVPIPKG